MQLVFRRMIVQVDLPICGRLEVPHGKLAVEAGGGGATLLPPRQQIHHTATGNFIDHQREPDLLSYTFAAHVTQGSPMSDTALALQSCSTELD